MFIDNSDFPRLGRDGLILPPFVVSSAYLEGEARFLTRWNDWLASLLDENGDRVVATQDVTGTSKVLQLPPQAGLPGWRVSHEVRSSSRRLVNKQAETRTVAAFLDDTTQAQTIFYNHDLTQTKIAIGSHIAIESSGDRVHWVDTKRETAAFIVGSLAITDVDNSGRNL